MTKKIGFIIFAILCISVGLYPALYFIFERTFALLASKSEALLNNTPWNIAFYTHIILGGLALLIGWTQFSKKLRLKNIKLHRNIGKTYVIAVLLSGTAGFYIACYATGGIISMTGFMCLAIAWLYPTIMAYKTIKKGDIKAHQKYMIFSYAVCFSAVTLRIWLPLLTEAFHSFLIAYKIVAWLCWIPNLIVAYFMTKRLGLQKG